MKEFLDEASAAYYNGTPVLSDEEFDRLARSYNYSSVGYKEEGGITIPFQMYSLQNVFVGDTLPLQEYDLVETLKLDGVAIALVYVSGILKSIITRGNGKVGKDISHLIPSFPAPKTITEKGLVQITGEIVAPKTIVRARNYASGALGLKDVEEFATRDLTFVAYGVAPSISDTYSSDLKYLYVNGFATVMDFNADKFPKDGIVYRINQYKDYNKLGFTAHHPRGAFALKKVKTGVTTTLLDVVWQVGKSGVVSPVAILEPVEIDETTVARATLHNMKYIEGLNLEIGCEVEVIKAGDIIPRIVSRVN